MLSLHDSPRKLPILLLLTNHIPLQSPVASLGHREVALGLKDQDPLSDLALTESFLCRESFWNATFHHLASLLPPAPLSLNSLLQTKSS